ncbi:MAG: glycosyltransferase [Clostridia bacterium]|nr:glycosyltransferase [Clostridia bacterium]
MSEQVIYAKACIERRPEYRQQTLIIRDGDTLRVRKTPVGAEAEAHIKHYAENYGKLTGALKKGARVSAVPCTLNMDGSMDFPFLTDPTLQDLLTGKSAAEYAERLLEYRGVLAEAFGEEPFSVTDAFTEYFGYVRLPEGLTALKVTNADMTFDNVFCSKDGNYTFIDYEWILPFPVPLQYLMYRALPQDPTYTAYTDAEKGIVLAALGISPETAEVYYQMEGSFIEQISPDETKLDTFLRFPEKRHTTVTGLEEILAAKAENERLTRDYNRYTRRFWFRLGRKAEDGARKTRDGLRTFARKDSFGGHCCATVSVFFREGPTASREKVILPLKSKRALKRCGRILGRSTETMGEMPETDAVLKISVLVPLYNTPAKFLEEMIHSVRVQTYRNWELCLADGSDENHPEVREICEQMAAEDGRIIYRKLEENKGISENTNSCIELASGAYLALLDHDDLLHPEALAEVVRAIRSEGADFVYTDEAVFESPDKSKLITAHFKPDWSPEKLLTNNYICHLSVFRASLLEKAGRFRSVCDGSQDYDLILRLTDCAEKVVHIPRALYFWRSHAASTASDISAKTFAVEAGKTALKDFLKTRRNLEVSVESVPEYPTLYHVKYPLKQAYTVNLILDLTGKTEAEIRDVLNDVYENTAYENVSVTVITDTAQAENPTPWPVSFVSAGGRHRPKRLNAAVKEATGDFLVFLDPELTPQGQGWLQEMMMLAQQNEIGAVGGKSFFADGRVRHGGLILGLGRAGLIGRLCFRFDGTSDGYFGQLAVAGNVSAVSAECMAIRREKFEACGGFEEAYRDTLFDADLCLKLKDAGYRNLFTPFALFRGGNAMNFYLDYGKESRLYRTDAETFRVKRGVDVVKPDPYYNPNLTTRFGNFSVK